MHRYVVTVFVMFCVDIISYNTLLSLRFENQMAKTATVKKLMEEEGISLRKAERQMDTNAFLDKCQCWGHCGSCHPFLMHQMFAHAMATGQKEHDWAMCQGWKQPSPE